MPQLSLSAAGFSPDVASLGLPTVCTFPEMSDLCASRSPGSAAEDTPRWDAVWPVPRDVLEPLVPPGTRPEMMVDAGCCAWHGLGAPSDSTAARVAPSVILPLWRGAAGGAVLRVAACWSSRSFSSRNRTSFLSSPFCSCDSRHQDAAHVSGHHIIGLSDVG